MYSIVWEIWINWHLEWMLQTMRHNQWLQSILKPSSALYDQFLAHRAEMIYELSITGQTIDLEKLLNDKFNNGIAAWTFNPVDYTYTVNDTNGIYIIDNPNQLPDVVLWNEVENLDPVWLYNEGEAGATDTWLFNQSEYNTDPDFIVMIPIAVGDVTDAVFAAQVMGWINQYRGSGTKCSLQNY